MSETTALNLFANTSKDAETNFTNVCSYILTTAVAASDRSSVSRRGQRSGSVL